MRAAPGARAAEADASLPEESWFGAIGVDVDLNQPASLPPLTEPLPLAPGAAADADPSAEAGSAAGRRIVRTYAAARAALGCGLALALAVAFALGSGRTAWWATLLCAAYALQAVALWRMPSVFGLGDDLANLGRGRRAWLFTVGVDLIVFASLHVLDQGSHLNFGALLVLPVLMAGVMSSRLVALATAAGVTLVLLAMALWGMSAGRSVAGITQAGLAGLGLFVIALLAGELAARLQREESAARGSLKLARQQAQLNRLVIDEMSEGVLVVDRRARVRAANPAARTLLTPVGLVAPAPFELAGVPAWGGLMQMLQRAFDLGHWPDDAREVVLGFADAPRTLQVRARFTRRRGTESAPAEAVEEFCVLFLEDQRAVHARVRQEKLAAMGRVSAGIAHEIRNPLAAIAQANALMMEDPLDPAQQRLATIVADNVERLKRIVDDVMEVAPGAVPVGQTIDLVATVSSICAEWARTVQLPLGADSRLQVSLPGLADDHAIGVVFDPEHLRRVLVNLLDNARRHAGPDPGAFVLRVRAIGDGAATLEVVSDGDPIPADVERHLFEPFFSTRSRGTGLGLYICRELCERYGASIDYRHGAPDARHRNEFQLRMPRVPLAPADHRLHL